MSDAPYALKIKRAEKHLDELKGELAVYEGQHPCAAIRDRNTNPDPDVWLYRAKIVQEPGPDLPLIIGDFIHNLRTALDYAVVALVPPSRKHDAKFLVVNDDIWETDPHTGKEVDRFRKQRESYTAAFEGLLPHAAAVVKFAQPYRAGTEAKRHPLSIIAALDNADKHQDLTVVTFGIKDPVTTLRYRDYEVRYQTHGAMTNGGGILFPRVTDFTAEVERAAFAAFSTHEAEMEVEVTGTPQVAIQRARVRGNFVIPKVLDNILHTVRKVCEALDPAVP